MQPKDSVSYMFAKRLTSLSSNRRVPHRSHPWIDLGFPGHPAVLSRLNALASYRLCRFTRSFALHRGQPQAGALHFPFLE